MQKARFNWRRILVAATLSLLAGYAGVRSTAETVVARWTTKGFTQVAYWYFADGYANVNCSENSVNGPGKPDPHPSAWANYQSEAWDWNQGAFHHTDLNASGDIPETALTYNISLSMATRCSFTGMPGNYSSWDNQGNWTSFPVTVTADSTLTAGDVQVTRTVNTQTVRENGSMTMTKSDFTGNYGFDVTGLGGLAATDPGGNVLVLIPEGTPVHSSSANSYARYGNITKTKF